MHISRLVEQDGVVDVLQSSTAIYVLIEPGAKPPVIYSDKEVVAVDIADLLGYGRLFDILSAESETRGRAMRAMILYEYDVSGLGQTDKQRVSHTLSGTGGRKSLLTEVGGRKVGRGAMIVPAAAEKRIDAFLKEHGAASQKRRVLMEEDG